MSKRPTLWMLIGVPCSGKSTWVENQIGDNDNIFIASTDNLIDAIAKLNHKSYNDVFHDTIKDAEKTMYKGLAIAVQDNMDIVWDQTNLTRKNRAKKLILIPDHYEKIAVVFSIPPIDELEKRLASRPGKNIPENVMRNMVYSFEYPEKDEGFDYILTQAEDHVYV